MRPRLCREPTAFRDWMTTSVTTSGSDQQSQAATASASSNVQRFEQRPDTGRQHPSDDDAEEHERQGRDVAPDHPLAMLLDLDADEWR